VFFPTLRLDADVIAWLRRQGRGYQTRANALLRDAMLEDLNPKRTKEGVGPALTIRVITPLRKGGAPVEASSFPP